MNKTQTAVQNLNAKLKQKFINRISMKQSELYYYMMKSKALEERVNEMDKK